LLEMHKRSTLWTYYDGQSDFDASLARKIDPIAKKEGALLNAGRAVSEPTSNWLSSRIDLLLSARRRRSERITTVSKPHLLRLLSLLIERKADSPTC
jgi:hypothetical protein